jgi:uncharacterized membrane protein
MVSSRTLKIVLIVLTVLGVALASYLTYVHYAEIKPLCTAGNACIKVQSSIYSKLAGIPVALIGLLGYIAILGALLAPEGENSRLAVMSLTLVGFGFSMYLTYRELFSIHAICEECATSAGILTVLSILSVWRFLRGDDGVSRAAGPSETLGAPERPSAAGEQAAPLGSTS